MGLLLILLFFFAILRPSVSSIDGLTLEELSKLQKKFGSYYTNNSIHVKGITIGGWLVTEPYITPSLYKNASELAKQFGNSSIIDEHSLCKTLGYDIARDLLKEHFATWITEDDFKNISNEGFNLVRIPIGYWAWKEDNATSRYINDITFKDPYVSDGIQLEYLQKAIDWASKYELNVWIDLHGAPGSQNGFDNSGQRNLYSVPGWLKKKKTTSLSIAVWQQMFESFINDQGEDSPIVGIEIVNEPLGGIIDINDIKQVYYEAFDLFMNTKNASSNVNFVIHDAFQGIGEWNLELNPNYHNVSDQYFNLSNITYESQSILVDHHHYEVFSDWQLADSQYDRLNNIISYGESIFEELSYHPSVIGEWSGAITDCATWLNGIGIGARYDGSYYKTTKFTTTDLPAGNCTSQNDFNTCSRSYKVQVRQFIEAQLATYSKKTSGWIFWNWKTENAIEWDYLKLREYDLFPYPFDNYTYFDSDGDIYSSVSRSLSKAAKTSSTHLSTKSTSTKPSTSFKKNGMSAKTMPFSLSTSRIIRDSCLSLTFWGVAILVISGLTLLQ